MEFKVRGVPAVRWVGAERTEAVEFKVRGVPAVRWVGAERTEAVEFKVRGVPAVRSAGAERPVMMGQRGRREFGDLLVLPDLRVSLG